MFISNYFLSAPLSWRISFRVGTLTMGVLLLASCAEMPTGPMVAVMPPANKPFDVFMQDDQLCRGWAAHSIGQPGHDAAAEQLLASMVTGAAIGAIAGAVGDGNRGAGTGAAVGTVIGATAGANQSAVTAGNAQHRYDIAYQQCMYSKGNLLPTYDYHGYYRYPAQAPAASLPPPPPAQLPPPTQK
jgi:hypothetical protein